MRITRFAAIVAVASLSLAPAWAQANLVRTRNASATISSLSAQLLDHTRTASGNRKNVWDADPPEPAVSGYHYFLYNMDGAGNAVGDGNESLTVTAIAAGPGYTINSAEILIKGKTPSDSSFFANVPISTTYDTPSNSRDFTDYFELGVIQVSFTLTDPSLAGLITSTDDSPELAYAGAPERGVEQFRIFTDTRINHDNDILRGAMSAYVPTGFVPGSSTFAPGFLDFGNGDVSTGFNVMPAAINTVVTPEPSALAGLCLAAVMLRRRPSQAIHESGFKGGPSSGRSTG